MEANQSIRQLSVLQSCERRDFAPPPCCAYRVLFERAGFSLFVTPKQHLGLDLPVAVLVDASLALRLSKSIFLLRFDCT
jgi:hypothetical protein